MKIKKIFPLILSVLFLFPSFCPGQEELTLKEYLEQILPAQEGRKIVVNEAIGLITVTDTPSNHKIIKKLIKQIDVGPSQVLIQARFVEVSVSDLNELGVEWYWYRAGEASNSKPFKDLRVGNAPDFLNPNNVTNADGITWPSEDVTDFTGDDRFPITGEGLDLFFSKTTFSGSYLRAYLHALEENGKANVLSSPKVTTLSGQVANIEVTNSFPYISEFELENIGTAEFPIWKKNYTTEERNIGIFLKVTPYVGSDSKYISLDLHPLVDVLVDQVPIHHSIPEQLGWPVVETRGAQTSVVVKSGETIVMGGLIKDDEEIINRKVPLLGDIPLLGNLFRHKYSRREKKNLLIFLTATLINSQGEEVR